MRYDKVVGVYVMIKQIRCVIMSLYQCDHGWYKDTTSSVSRTFQICKVIPHMCTWVSPMNYRLLAVVMLDLIYTFQYFKEIFVCL